LKTTVSHPVGVLDGFTQASRVMPVVRSSELESGILTRSLTPSKRSAFPYLPVVTQTGPFVNVPAFEFPDESERVVPDPSSNPYSATKPGLAAAWTTEWVSRNKLVTMQSCRNARSIWW